ncbi:MAG: hypothetical protein DRI56_03875 [Chloroflexota bacterium]|nr:MAG: hypothetical protein DRI56_03875 [Chloroflexota bacterium]
MVPSTLTATPSLTDTPYPTMTPSVTPQVNAEPFLYYTQAGDTLPVVAIRFGVNPDEIESPDPIPPKGFIAPGQLLIIPHGLLNTTSNAHLLPDSELVYSPSARDFDVVKYVEDAGGYLSTYSEYLGSIGQASGGEIIAHVALVNSVNPRVLLALLEYQSGWVFGEPQDLRQKRYPFEHVNYQDEDLLAQVRWAVNQLSIGYYGWREGRLTGVSLTDAQNPDKQVMARLAPELNAGTVAIQYYFSQIYDSTEWVQALNAESGFPALYKSMFGDPAIRAMSVEPLFPPDLTQPPMELPFLRGPYWSYTGGPHGAWEREGSWAAVDFAPSAKAECATSTAWVTSSTPGRVMYAHYGLVIIDLDDDGSAQTGWVLIYLHIREDGRVQVGEWVETGDLLGHPSCEGGLATGVHVHMARKYNGEWIAADGPVPFVLSGWTVHGGSKAYEGTLTKGGETVTASPVGADVSRIRLEIIEDED